MTVQLGTYRGICINNVDPLGLNRLQVQVPQIMGEATSGWAYPAWTLADMEIWPQDRFPNPGDGVWITLESPDRMTWGGTYGLPEQAGEDPPGAFDVEIDWVLPALTYNQATVIRSQIDDTHFGVHSLAGVPNPDPRVVLQHVEDPDTGTAPESWAWTDVSSPVDVALDGSFSIPYTRTIQTNPHYRVRFLGTGAFDPMVTEPKKYIIPSVAPTLTWTQTAIYWQSARTFSGNINSTEGIPEPARVDIAMKRTADPDTSYAITHSTTASAATGNWSLSYTRTEPAPISIKAMFQGHDVWTTVETAVQTYPVVETTPALTWNFNSLTLYLGVAVTISGNITSTYGTPSGTVAFQTGPSDTGPWTTRINATPNASGAWSFSYTPDTASQYYRMDYAGSGIYLPVSTAAEYRNIQFTTTTTITSFPGTMTLNTAFNVSGTVIDSASGGVSRGTVELWYKFNNGGDLTWKKTGATTPAPSSGNFTISHPANSVVGPLDWKVKFVGDGGSFLPSESTVRTMSIAMASIPALTKGGLTLTSADFSWAGVSYAGRYRIYRGINNGGVSSLDYTTGTSYSNGGLGYDTTYGYVVAAQKQDAAGNWVEGPGSPQIKMYTGHPEQRDQYSGGPWEIICGATNNYRNDSSGWGYQGDRVMQGYYSSAYGGAGYYGVIDYGHQGIWNWMVNNLGQARADNFNMSNFYVYLIRYNVGNSAHLNMDMAFFSSDSAAGSSISGSWEQRNRTSPPRENGAWYELDWRFGIEFTTYRHRSILVMWHDSAHYAGWYGRSSGPDNGKCHIYGGWDYQTVAPASSGWY